MEKRIQVTTFILSSTLPTRPNNLIGIALDIFRTTLGFRLGGRNENDFVVKASYFLRWLLNPIPKEPKMYITLTRVHTMIAPQHYHHG